MNQGLDERSTRNAILNEDPTHVKMKNLERKFNTHHR